MQSQDHHLHAVPAAGTAAYPDVHEIELQLPSESSKQLAPDQSQAGPEPFDQAEAQHLMHPGHHQSPLTHHYQQQMSSMFMQQPASQPLLSDDSEHQRPDGMALPFPHSGLEAYARAAEEQVAHAQAQHSLAQQESMPLQHGSEEAHYQSASNDGMLSPNDPDRK